MREKEGLVIESYRGQEEHSLGRVFSKDSAGDMEAETEIIRRHQTGRHGMRTLQAKRKLHTVRPETLGIPSN